MVGFGVTRETMGVWLVGGSWHLETGILVGLILQLHILAVLIVVVIVQSVLTVAGGQPVLRRRELFIDQPTALVLVAMDTLALVLRRHLNTTRQRVLLLLFVRT